MNNRNKKLGKAIAKMVVAMSLIFILTQGLLAGFNILFRGWRLTSPVKK